MVETIINAFAIIGAVSILVSILKKTILSFKELGLKKVELHFERDNPSLIESKSTISALKLKSPAVRTGKLKS